MNVNYFYVMCRCRSASIWWRRRALALSHSATDASSCSQRRSRDSAAWRNSRFCLLKYCNVKKKNKIKPRHKMKGISLREKAEWIDGGGGGGHRHSRNSYNCCLIDIVSLPSRDVWFLPLWHGLLKGESFINITALPFWVFKVRFVFESVTSTPPVSTHDLSLIY